MIKKAIERAYQTMIDREWDTIYWAIDLHGVCMQSNYKQSAHEFISQDAINALQYISSLRESKIILWSSVHDDEKLKIVSIFNDNGIEVFDFNQNIEVADTNTGSFKEKFYFSILLDDKAGFDPDTDWQVVLNTLKEINGKA